MTKEAKGDLEDWPCSFCGVAPDDRVPYCDGSEGVIRSHDDPFRTSPCPNQSLHWRREWLETCGVPKRFRSATIRGFQPSGRGSRILKAAKDNSATYASGFIPEGERATTTGLLYVGPPGCGKTHLASAVLMSLVNEHVIRGVFCVFSDLCADIQATFSNNQRASKESVLRPILTAPILALDELGATKPTDWVLDTLYQIVNSRYMDELPTLFTSNYPLSTSPPERSTDRKIGSPSSSHYAEPLDRRVGDRIASRLCEMTTLVDMTGAPDYRRK